MGGRLALSVIAYAMPHSPFCHLRCLQIEACAQVGAVAILSLEENKGKTAYFGAVNNARFKRKVVPGDKLKMECEIIKKKGPVGVGKAVATVDGEVALTAELTFMVG